MDKLKAIWAGLDLPLKVILSVAVFFLLLEVFF